jgi:hypothetical protein
MLPRKIEDGGKPMLPLRRGTTIDETLDGGRATTVAFGTGFMRDEITTLHGLDIVFRQHEVLALGAFFVSIAASLAPHFTALHFAFAGRLWAVIIYTWQSKHFIGDSEYTSY